MGTFVKRGKKTRAVVRRKGHKVDRVSRELERENRRLSNRCYHLIKRCNDWEAQLTQTLLLGPRPYSISENAEGVLSTLGGAPHFASLAYSHWTEPTHMKVLKTIAVCIMVFGIVMAAQMREPAGEIMCGVITLLGGALYYWAKKRTRPSSTTVNSAQVVYRPMPISYQAIWLILMTIVIGYQTIGHYRSSLSSVQIVEAGLAIVFGAYFWGWIFWKFWLYKKFPKK